MLLLATTTMCHAAGGLLLLSNRSSSHVSLVGYSTLTQAASHVCYITDKTGKRTQVMTANIIANIPFPPAPRENADALIGELEMLANQYPQYAKSLNVTKQAWEKQRAINASASPRPQPVVTTQQAPPQTKLPAPVVSQPIAQPLASAPSTADALWDSLLNKLKTGDLDAAFGLARHGVKAFPSDQPISEINQRLVQVTQAVQAVQAAQKAILAAQPEIQRLRRNADVNDGPNLLIPGDNSAQRRAEADRNKANTIEEQCQKSLDNAKDSLSGALEAIQKLGSSFRDAGVYDGAVALAESARLFAVKHGISSDSQFTDTRSMQASLLEADTIYSNAQAAFAKKEIREAGKNLDNALKSFPQSRKSLALKAKTDAITKECSNFFQETQELKKSKKYEAALASINKIFLQAVDFDEAAELKSELQKIIADKEEQFSTAMIKEQSQDYEAALKIYDTYSNKEGISRVSIAMGERDEKAGNFLAAIVHYERAGMGEKAGLLRAKSEEQKAAYKKADLLRAEEKIDEAIAIYESYHDQNAIHSTLIAAGNKDEEKGKFEAALVLYRKAEAVDHIERVQRQIEERAKLVAEGRKKEEAGDYEAAVTIYEDGGAFEEMKRVAFLYAKLLETRKDFTGAVYYYEIAELPAEAKRIRETHVADVASVGGGRKLEAKEIYEKNIDSVVTIISRGFNSGGTGTGFFVKRGGWIVTNRHVIDEAERITVRTNDKREYPARLVSKTTTPDFALLKIELPFHSVVKIGRSAGVKAGEKIFAIGSPGDGEGGVLDGTITSGIISNPSRVFAENRVIQMDAAINHGNSGGPLFLETNQVVGINTFGLGTATVVRGVSIGSDIQNVNFAIHMDEITPLIEKHAK